jgi:hypothetical protein
MVETNVKILDSELIGLIDRIDRIDKDQYRL